MKTIVGLTLSLFCIFAVTPVFADCSADGKSYGEGWPICAGGQPLICKSGKWEPNPGGVCSSHRIHIIEALWGRADQEPKLPRQNKTDVLENKCKSEPTCSFTPAELFRSAIDPAPGLHSIAYVTYACLNAEGDQYRRTVTTFGTFDAATLDCLSAAK